MDPAPVSPPDTSEIDEVLEKVKKIVDSSLEQKHRSGYFAAMYLRMTQRVKEGILRGDFEDGSRMSHFDKVFADYYLGAHSAWRRQEQINGPWAVAFRESEKRCPIALQHLLLGMNAHINYDLGLAVVDTCQDQPLPPLKQDYDQINLILKLLLDEIQSALNGVSPVMGVIDFLGAQSDELLAQFSIEQARAGAWKFATRVSTSAGAARTQELQHREGRITELAHFLAKPGLLLRLGVATVGVLESRNVRRVIEHLLQEA